MVSKQSLKVKLLQQPQAARDAKAGNSSTMNKAKQAVIGKKVAGGVKKAWGKAAGGLANVAQKSGFGNPITASKKHADNMVEKSHERCFIKRQIIIKTY